MRRRLLVAAAAAAVSAAGVLAQIEGGDRGVAAVDSSNDLEVRDIRVDATGPDAEAARLAGWRQAQRKAWVQLSQRLGAGGALVSDNTLDSVVSSIVVEHEQIGPNRYVARLGVLFDRARAGGVLGVSTAVTRSPPFVVVPVQWYAGVGTVFERRTPWQEAWARYRTGSSAIDYIRPTGNGPDPLMLNVGQVERPARGWWRAVLDQYGGTDVLIPVARLYRQSPGGPIVGVFEARYGPDNRLLRSFTLRVGSPAGMAALLDEAVRRMDRIYQDGLNGGYLGADIGLNPIMPDVAPTPVAAPDDVSADMAAPVITITVQFDTPDAGAVNGTEAVLRSIPGVSSAATTSLALGGISLMSVSYAGTPEAFRAALEARGWQVFGSGVTVRIRRAPQPPAPEPQAGGTVAG